MRFLFMDFLNSEWRDGIRDDFLEDRLDKPGWWENVMAYWGMTVDRPITETERKEIKALRSRLRVWVEKLAEGKQLNEEDLHQINTYLHQVPVHRVLVPKNAGYGWRLLPDQADWRWVASEIVASLAELLVRHDPGRIRICENRQCLWVFYDESRNRSRRWCDHRTCGNRMNVRKHRQRKRHSKGGQPENE
ncbi:CGNR zinc finger domain-containing protein [Polycladomyces subterraneus]|uniref:CGNR zinc finger domain-containing protein n=1 Tax=Polycladomyces subterraneus TaxID=1016997 RepID=A0ABT8IN68_9BACL|nr:CGNR zinc finger domain-containing protein [Polycladomyces subterraneus]MDN4594175.1 CGNR zinc finger domain-containing protein [Polycladomyces subterraneus]